MKEMSLEGNTSRGWVHVMAGVGVYASTRDPVYTVLRSEPSIAQLRRDDYQGIGLLDSVEESRPMGSASIIEFIDVSAAEYMSHFNHPRITEMEQRWQSIGKTDKYFDRVSDMYVTCGLHIAGPLDALVITPDFNINYYEVQQAGRVIFSQRLIEPTAKRSLGFALLLFKENVLSYVEVSCHSNSQPVWLELVSDVPVVFR